MAKLTKSITVNAPVEKVFEFARDVGRLWACFPEVAVRDVELKPDGVGSSARWFTHTLGIHNEGTIEFTGVVPNQRILAKSSAGPTFTFTFEADGGGTKLTVDAEWHLPVPLVGPPVEALIMKRSEKDGEAMLAGIKAQVEGTAA
ncbi:SRPBCC family protein [Pseudarthrobacter sp. ATCC 49987]|uniref:SRPBCC family protein n=1 Tax=Pseudarthrobacter sp. ATCC 49987 TaxID=2698204 RepID=UPI001372050D|nr:SRPBCC family protein [Pseudarthrobacter sp. ATCC 49987]